MELAEILVAADPAVFLGSASKPFDSPYLNDLLATAKAKKPLPSANLLIAPFTPVGIDFRDPNTVAITYTAAVAPVKYKASKSDFRERVALDPIGSYTIEIVCPYRAVSNAALKRLDVFAILGEATLTVEADTPDLKRLHDASVFGRDSVVIGAPRDKTAIIHDYVLNRPSMHLTPSLSLIGQTSSTAGVPELPVFNPVVSHVGRGDRQALVVAFDLQPGHKGDINEVRHFIGGRDYGVIHDEYFIDRLFQNKWRLGGFLRKLTLQAPTKVKHADKVVNATLHGTVTLNTLGAVRLETVANVRSDFLVIHGSGSAIVNHLELEDGTIVGRDKVDLGPEGSTPWGIHTSLTTSEAVPTDPQFRAFESRAHDDAYKHLGRPFVRYHDERLVKIVYTRLEAVTKHALFLGMGGPT